MLYSIVINTILTVTFFQMFLSYEEQNSQVANLSKASKTEHNTFKKCDEYNGNYSESKDINNEGGTIPSDNFAISFSNATAKWTDKQTENSLEDINLKIKPGQLIGIIGPVGAGKVNAIYHVQSLKLNKKCIYSNKI